MLNTMCLDCKKLNNDCKGTECQTWSGCIYKEKTNLQSTKENALQIYRETKEKYLNDMSKENWISFCDAKANCMRLGVII